MAEHDVNERQQELSCLASIYPQELTIDRESSYTTRLDLPLALRSPLRIYFNQSTNDDVQYQHITSLPPLRLDLILPAGYPSQTPPSVTLNAAWLAESLKEELENRLAPLWTEYGQTNVLLPYIDFIQENLQSTFETMSAGLQVSREVGAALLAHDKATQRHSFEQQTFECGICLEPKKGALCHRLEDCQHVFCVVCLRGFYSSCIREGNLSAVKCPAAECANRHSERKFLSCEELGLIPLESDLVRRYAELRRKRDLDIDPLTTWCPRPWCDGAARNSYPGGVRKDTVVLRQEEGEESPATTTPSPSPSPLPASSSALTSSSATPLTTTRLRICVDCSFAFCAACNKSWHGAQNACSIPSKSSTHLPGSSVRDDELDPELDQKYLHYNCARCPSCKTPYNKLPGEGCDHMLCPKCETRFCYRCETAFPTHRLLHDCYKPEYEMRNVEVVRHRVLRRG